MPEGGKLCRFLIRGRLVTAPFSQNSLETHTLNKLHHDTYRFSRQIFSHDKRLLSSTILGLSGAWKDRGLFCDALGRQLAAMDDFASDTDSDYTSYWRDWVSAFFGAILRLWSC